MRTIIDTHIFLHMLGNPARLSTSHRSIVTDPQNDLASIWEITTKYSLGKLQLPAPPEIIFPAQLQNFGIELLPITLPEILAVRHLPRHHNDPFDRLMIAQATVHNLPIISDDAHFPKYGIHLI
ncbi:MAG: type II toxin-antitoxin system VapC family toxin [Phycisphaerales bacterium]|nr:type II toxin-antitoxin system VapC family toxin [Phycisphaerales bacterium]